MHKAVFAWIALALACQSERRESHKPPSAVLESDLRVGSPDAPDYFPTQVSELEVNGAGTVNVVQHRAV